MRSPNLLTCTKGAATPAISSTEIAARIARFTILRLAMSPAMRCFQELEVSLPIIHILQDPRVAHIHVASTRYLSVHHFSRLRGIGEIQKFGDQRRGDQNRMPVFSFIS